MAITKNNSKIKFVNITKQFGSLTANKDINFSVYENEVHALLGENGAGKSTLMSILFGLYKPTKGHIEINGNKVAISDPKQANELKIAMLPQHFKLVDNMSVLENVMLGYELTKAGFLDKKSAIEKIEIAKNKYKINIDLKAMVGNLSVSDKQKVELLKILWGDADILIFDEPTSILTPLQIKHFLKLIKDLKSAGKTILLITHKLDEIKEVADRVTVIRKGEYIKTVSSNTSAKELANLMVGKTVDLNLSSIKKDITNENLEVLKVSDLSYEAKGYEKSLSDINFNIKSGEILGIAAIDGNGQSELMKILGGIVKSTGGEISIGQHDASNLSSGDLYYSNEEYTNDDTILRVMKVQKKFEGKPKSINVKKPYDEQLEEAIKIANIKLQEKKEKADYNEADFYWNRQTSLLSHIPEDRHEHGLILDYSVMNNSVLQDLKFFSNKFGILNKKSMKLRLDYLKEKYDVRGIQDYNTPARTLSGGNQQKLILGREIERGSNVLLAVHPTRGLDVGAIRNVYENIIKARNEGTAILLSSGELDEIMQVSDRIMVMYEGKIVSITQANKLNKLELGSLMATGKLSSNVSKGTKKLPIKKRDVQNKNVKKKVAKASTSGSGKKTITSTKSNEVIKYVYKNPNGDWVVSNGKTGKTLRKAKTQNSAIALAGTYKNVTHIMIKNGRSWENIHGDQVKAANSTRLSAKDKRVKGGK